MSWDGGWKEKYGRVIWSSGLFLIQISIGSQLLNFYCRIKCSTSSRYFIFFHRNCKNALFLKYLHSNFTTRIMCLYGLLGATQKSDTVVDQLRSSSIRHGEREKGSPSLLPPFPPTVKILRNIFRYSRFMGREHVDQLDIERK